VTSRTVRSPALCRLRFLPEASAFISWLGVTQYLSATSVSDTLCWAAGCAPGSEITTEQMTDVLRQAGFRQIEHFSPEQANNIYSRARTDDLGAHSGTTGVRDREVKATDMFHRRDQWFSTRMRLDKSVSVGLLGSRAEVLLRDNKHVAHQHQPLTRGGAFTSRN
jgi:hypothetical protein